MDFLPRAPSIYLLISISVTARKLPLTVVLMCLDSDKCFGDCPDELQGVAKSMYLGVTASSNNTVGGRAGGSQNAIGGRAAGS